MYSGLCTAATGAKRLLWGNNEDVDDDDDEPQDFLSTASPSSFGLWRLPGAGADAAALSSFGGYPVVRPTQRPRTKARREGAMNRGGRGVLMAASLAPMAMSRSYANRVR